MSGCRVNSCVHLFFSAKQLIKGEPNVSYICSRYYRAPELIFGATDYTVDIGKCLFNYASTACRSGFVCACRFVTFDKAERF